ncbi:MAG: V-type ATP synthase subunit D [Oscillospiraceae bacterium]|nr:V-type ATP synthase subunit D [Oscillospiraceae bacterium]
MASKITNPTRVELESLKGKLLMARRGHKLLKDKRDGLMRQFLLRVRKAARLRKDVEKIFLKSSKNFSLARAYMGNSSIRAALMITKQEITVSCDVKNVLSVRIPEFKLNSRTNTKFSIHPYGYVYTSCDLDIAMESLFNVLEDMIKLANLEKSCQLMAEEIEKTRRRVNAIEHVIIPQTLENIKFISMKISENERSTQVRLIKVKDMIIKRLRKI